MSVVGSAQMVARWEIVGFEGFARSRASAQRGRDYAIALSIIDDLLSMAPRRPRWRSHNYLEYATSFRSHADIVPALRVRNFVPQDPSPSLNSTLPVTVFNVCFCA